MSGMKKKTIKKIIKAKIDDWLESIEDTSVRELAAKGTIVTGGSIASMLMGEHVNDFDLYFRDHKTALAVAKYYVGRFTTKTAKGIPCNVWVEDSDGRIRVVIKSAGIASEEGAEASYEYFESRPADEAQNYVAEVMSDPGSVQDAYDEAEDMALEEEDTDGKPKYRPVFMSSNAITLSNRVQLILRFYGEPDQIHENYDFVHCTNYYSSWDDTITLRPAALEALLSKELRYVGSKYPICSIIRLRKFIKRGWTINAGQILKMVMQAAELDLKDPQILQDQLTGVDAAYFIQLMAMVRDKDPEKVNCAYLVEIIDRLF